MKKKISISILLLFIILVAFNIKNSSSSSALLLDQLKFDNRDIQLVLDNDKLLLKDGLTLNLKNDFVLNEKKVEQPEMLLFNDIILVHFYWKTNKLGSLLELWTYNPKDKSIEKLIDIDQRVVSTYKLKNNIIQIDEIDFSSKAFIADSTRDYVKDTETLEISDTITFSIVNDELVTKRIIFTGAVNWLENNKLYTYYSYENNKLSLKNYKLEK